MHRWTNWLASIGVGAGVVLGTWAMASAQSLPLDPTGVTVPTLAMTVPIVTVPTLPPVEPTVLPVDTTLPPVTTVPGVTVPPVPTTVALPDPEVTVPTVPTSVDVPLVGPVTVPTLPGVTVPTLPGVTIPPVLSTVPGGVRPDGLVECAHFVTQQAAQLALQLDSRLAALLDADRDGVACELLPSGPATVPAGSNGTVNLASLPAGSTAGAAGAAGAAAPLGSAVGDPSGSGGDGSDAGAGPGGFAGAGAAPGTVTVSGDPLAATSPLEVPEADAGHLVLVVLAFVLLVGSSAGLARELSARHAARAGAPEVALA